MKGAEATYRFRTLGVHPTGRGFGWVICEGPFNLIEAGTCTPLRDRGHLTSLRHFERLIARFRPAELVLEAFEAEPKGRCRWARRLGLDMLAIATDRGLTVEGHSRAVVQGAFNSVGAKTREEIAAAIARHFPALAHRLPPKRRAWNAEDRRLAIFNAAAVVLAHFHNGATALLDEKRNAA
ncbi:MAG TPA: hypothetical protein VL358_06500 [Caulobacteraceae bacterium]|jgi:hypothetical protein|nr:hypothetical protein [Caulobacteraceae bacterium]